MSKFIGPIEIEFTYYYYLKTKLEYGKITFSMNVPLLKILHNYVRMYVLLLITLILLFILLLMFL